MKRKFINALVFGALLVAPAGSFVSCSDYDDDISSLREDLDATKQNLQSLVDGRITTIETEIANLKTADENLAAAVEEAKGLIADGDAATLEGARALVEDARKQLEEALQETADGLSERDAQLQLAITDAQTKADQAYDLASEAKTAAEAAAATANENKTQLEALAQKLDGVEGNLADILSGLEESVKTLSDDMVQAQADISRIDGALTAQQATLDILNEWKGGADEDIKQALADIAQLQKDLAQQKADLEKYVDDAVAIVAGEVDDLRTDVDGLKEAYAAADEDLQEQIDGLNTSLTDLDKAVDGLEQSIADLEKKLDENINVLQTLLKNALRGLVFQPEMFVDGIEAQEYAYAQYNPLVATSSGASSGTNPDKKTFTITDANSGATTWRYGKAVNTLTINPVTTLTYHMNPSSAKVAFGDLGFVWKDVQVITRSDAANPSTAENDLAGNKVFSCGAGLLNVGVTADGPSIEGKGNATILALQAKVNKEGDVDTLITSDYAMLYATQVTFDEIVFTDGTDAVDCTGKEDGLYKTAVEAVSSIATHKIVYTEYGDDATGLDLKSKVALHFTHDTKSDKKVTHKVMSQEEAAKYGLTFDFKLINYTVGDNKTSDSKYATIDETTGVLKTRTVDEKGNTIVPGNDNLAAPAIGREPLVRVRVMQGSNVVLVGFIKVDIVQKTPEALEDITAGIFDGDSQPVDACGNPSDVTTTWSWTSAKILGTLGLDIAEFHERYELELDGGEAKQYSAPGTLRGTNLGVVTEKPEEQGSVTTVLNWNLSAADRQTIWEATDHTATIYVKYVPKTNYVETNAAVYVGLKVAITKPAAGTLGDKATGYWEDDRVKLNVHYPKDGKTVSEEYFDYDLDDFWKDKIVKFSRSDVASGAYKYYFDPSMTTVAGRNVTLKNKSGNTYGVTRGIETMDGRRFDWTPENEFNYQVNYEAGVYTLCEVWVGTTKIATLNQANGIVKYEDNDVAKEMLNSGRLAVELKIAIAGKNSCGQVVPTTGNTFTAAFYRPVNLAAAADIPHFVDAANNGSSVNVFDMLSFTDWRNEAFTGSNGWLFGYYEISRVYIGKDDGGSDDASVITTTVGGGQLGQDKLTRYPEIVVSLTGNTPIIVTTCTEANSAAIIDKVKKQLGKITVKNTGASVTTYQLRVPLTIEYAWGKLTVNVDLTVDSTMQSNRK